MNRDAASTECSRCRGIRADTPFVIVYDGTRGNVPDLELGSWSRDGRFLAYADITGIWIRDLALGSSRLVTRAGSRPRPQAPIFSPDDSLLAFAVGSGRDVNVAPNEIWVAPLAGGTAVQIMEARHFNTSPVFTPDGRSLLFVSNRDGARDIYQQPLRGRQPRGEAKRLTVGAHAISISLSGDGRLLAYGVLVRRSNIWSLPIRPRGVTPISAATQVTFGDQEVEGLSVSRDGAWLVYDSDQSGNQDIYRMPLAGGAPIRLTTDPADDFWGMMSPDGRETAFYSFRAGGRRQLHTMLADGTRQRLVIASPEDDEHMTPDWSPDGNQLVFTSSRTPPGRFTIVSRMASGGWGDRRDVSGHRGVIRWSPDGRYLAAGSDSGVVLLSPNDGKILRVLVSRGQLGGATVPMVVWGLNSSLVFFRTADPGGGSAIWSIPVSGGPARLLLRLESMDRVTRRDEFATDGKRLFFILNDDRASLWLLELGRGKRAPAALP